MEGILQQLKCRFVQLMALFFNRSVYRIASAKDTLTELNKVRRFIFFLQSECGVSNEFYADILQYFNNLDPIEQPCLNCNDNEYTERQFS